MKRFYYRNKLTESSNGLRTAMENFEGGLLPSKKSEEERHIVIIQEVISDKNIIVNSMKSLVESASI